MPMSVSGADAKTDEAVPMLMERPSNQLSKMVASVVGASVVMTQYEMSKCEMRDEECVCSV
jgi:hypothetical protein